MLLLLGDKVSRDHAASTSSSIMELTDHTFSEYSKTKDFLLVNFYAPWCSDSKDLAPELEKTAYTLGRRSNDIVKVDCFGKGRRLCEIYGIKHWPTLKTFRHGILNTEYTGSHHAESIINYVNGAEDMLASANSNGMSNTPLTVGPVLETASNNNNNNNNNNDNNNNNNNGNSVTKTCTSEAASSSSKSPSPSTSSSSSTSSSTSAGVNSPTATYEKPEIVPASSYASAGTSDVGTALGVEKVLGTGTATEEVVTITPQGNVEVGSPQQSTGEKVASLAAAAALVTPPADVINQLECAKCKIMTPVQRSQSASCRQYKRSCIPSHLTNPAAKLAAIKAAAAAKEKYEIDKRQRLYF